MTARGISEDALLAQEACFARAFGDGDPAVARDLYQPDVVYVSPTVRLFDWPARIDGIERTLEFIALTIRACPAIRYEAVEHAITPGADAAFRARAVRLDRGCGTPALDVRGDLSLSRRPDSPPGAVLRPERGAGAARGRLSAESQSR